MASAIEERIMHLHNSHESNIQNVHPNGHARISEITHVKDVYSTIVAETLTKWASRYGPPEFAACIAEEIETHTLK